MSKEKSTWHSSRLDQEITVARWGELGQPVLIYPTAGGDAEECERFLMIDALAELLDACRIKVYSVDSIAGQAWMTRNAAAVSAATVQNRFDAAIAHEVVPAIRKDCDSNDIEVIVTGASIGAFNALAAICRHPDLFSHAICMSGTYDLGKFFHGPQTGEYREVSPLHFLPEMNGAQLERLRERFVLLTHGQGRWESPEESWRAAHALGGRRVPNRVTAWGDEWDHDWQTWRKMLPLYLDELV